MPGRKGIVVATAGAGATSGTQGEGIRYAARKGGVRRDHHANRQRPDLRRDGERASPAQDLAPIKARILLMLALTKTRDAEELRRIFREY